MRYKGLPRLFMIVSMTIFGTIALFVRSIPLSSGEIAFWRAVLATVIIGGVLLVSKEKPQINGVKSTLPLLLLSGVAMGFNWILLFEAYEHTTVSSATLSYYFAPVIVTVVCPFLFRERLSALQILCFAASTVGLVLITDIGSVGREDVLGIALGLCAACLYAGVVLINKLVKGVKGIHRTFFQFLAAAITLLPYVLFTGGFQVHTLALPGFASLLTVGVVHSGIAYCMYFSAIRDLPGQKAAILSYVDPLVAVLISVFVLGEEITLPQIIGGVLILGFSLLNELLPTRHKKDAS